MTNVVVTGGAGFIGSNLVDALVARGDRVHVIDNLVAGKRNNLAGAIEAGAVLHKVDVRDAAAVDHVFQAAMPELVFHLAAQIDVRSSVEEPGLDAATNVLGAVNVLESCRRHQVMRAVYTSTGGALYGEADQIPTPESYPIHPLAPYGQSKFAAEGYFHLYSRLYGISTITLRYGNVYGPRQDIDGEAGVVAIFCGRLMSGAIPIVYGDGLQTRDWIDVSDIVQANLVAAASSYQGSLNVGNGHETTLLELIDVLRQVGRERGLILPEAVYEPERLGEVRRSCLAVDKAMEHLGWEAQVSLHDGLHVILDWLGAHPLAREATQR